GGFGVRGSEGKIAAARFAREERIPFFGGCLGLQIAGIEIARHLAGLPMATSTEFHENTQCPVIDIMEHQKKIQQKGATMRLGAYPCVLADDSLSRKIYGSKQISERHRHRFEVNNDYLDALRAAGLKMVGMSPDGRLVEMIEFTDHPWFIGVQSHPEL